MTELHSARPSAPWRQWGDDIDAGAIAQMQAAADLPISVSGALMPDAHLGYGLPVGGVLATRGAVIPYAVGVDIACRMRLSVLDTSVGAIRGQADKLRKTLERETAFGVGGGFKTAPDHDVMDGDWDFCEVTRMVRGRAGAQLGSSGSGNHFVEFGELTLERPDLGLEAGNYLALLSHSGSRGAGAAVANHYSKLAESLHPTLVGEQRRLAWLDLDSDPGREYWAAMELMGRYAAANHEIIHARVARALRADVLAGIENHHNFAWKESHGGEDVIVHRKGATPAGVGVMGVIPGTMATPGYMVRGLGNAESLNSASHGAGRAMSRTKAKGTLRWAGVRPSLEAAGVTLISAGIDEAPPAYKDIEAVMAAQRDLVQVVGRFDPRIVKMAPAGERPED
jgi:tRNA-splicing ligase RtcB (3'-phosphate/5'-hydroxy nucleic acid ligase)